MGDRVIGIERIRVGVGDQHIGAELADRLDHHRQTLRCDVERVVAQVKRTELGAERARGLLSLGVTHALDVLDRLSLLLPQLP